MYNIIAFFLAFLCFIPKGVAGTIGFGTFNIGWMDLTILLTVMYLISSNGFTLKSFSSKYDRDFIVAIVLIAMISAVFSSHPLVAIKNILKLIEAVIVYLFFCHINARSFWIILCGLLTGALVSLFFLDFHLSDSKIYSASYLITGIGLLLIAMREDSKKTLKFRYYLFFMVFIFVFLSFLTYPKKGAVLAFVVAIVLLFLFKQIKINKVSILIIVLVVASIFIFPYLNPRTHNQSEEVVSFLSGEQNEYTSSLYMRGLQYLLIPKLILHPTSVGYGTSQLIGGIDSQLYADMKTISLEVFGFVPYHAVFHIGSNIYSDNLYVTLAAELGLLSLLLLFFLIRVLKNYYTHDKLTFIYIISILVFSVSTIDIGIYRGTQIFFLNPLLFAFIIKSKQTRPNLTRKLPKWQVKVIILSRSDIKYLLKKIK